MNTKKRAFVTGSTGFLGLNLMEELKKGGWEITALHLPGEDLSAIKGFGARCVSGNILDYQSLLAAIPGGVDAVFHMAGDTSTWRKNDERQYAINVTGTKNMVGAAVEKNVARFIHTSSISAFGFHDSPISENTESNALSCGISYHRTKYLGEQEVRKGMEKGLRAIIINPCNVIGPYDRVNWSQMIRAVYNERLPGIPPGTGTFAHVRDVVRAHLAAAVKGRPGESYVLGGTEASFKEIFNEIEAILGKPQSVRIISKRALWLAMCFFSMKSIFNGREPDITYPKYRRLVGRVTCDDAKAVKELGFRKSTLREMLTDSYEWLLKENLLKN